MKQHTLLKLLCCACLFLGNIVIVHCTPTIQFDKTSSTGPEGSSPVTFLVDLSGISASNVTVNYTVTGTASGSGVDYTLANGTLTINANQTNGTISAIIIDDATVEGSETIIITLSSPTNATLGTNTVHTYTILNDDDSTPYVVDNLATDTDDGNYSTGNLTLREAITRANANSGFDVINFNFGSAGPYIINLSTALPALTDNSGIMINGFSNPGASANTISVFNATPGTPMNAVYKVILNNYSGTVQKGLTISGNNNIIKGLVLPNFGTATYSSADVAISITGTGNYILGCYVGMKDNGATSGSGTNDNTWVGIYSSANNNSIGDGTPAGANLISGVLYTGINIQSPATGNSVRGNMIGLQKNGIYGVRNMTYGIDLYASSNTIGSPIPGQGNVISGCGANGITVHSNSNVISGNIIGLAADGMSRTSHSYSHQSSGIYMELASSTTIGGPNAGARNIISDNSTSGILMFGSSNSNIITNNYIGPNASGDKVTGASQFYGINASTQNNKIGGYSNYNDPNLIAYNGYGINIQFTSATGNLISRNRIFGNTIKPIELWLAYSGLQANGNKPLPTITSMTSTSVSGGNAKTGSVGDSVEVFKNPEAFCGYANTYLGTTKADASGNWTLSGLSLGSCETVMATARTISNNNTSEFSTCPAIPNGPTISGTTVICSGETTVLMVSAGTTYSWNTGATTQSITVSQPYSSPYTVRVTNDTACTRILSQAITVNVPPTANAGSNIGICSGSSTGLGGSPTATGGTSPYTYSWSPSTALNSTTIANPTANPTTTTTYTVSVTDAKGCVKTATKTVSVFNINAGSNSAICAGGVATLGGSPTVSGGTSPYTYIWTPSTGLNSAAIANPVAAPAATTTYTLSVSDAIGCSMTGTVTVTVNNLPSLSSVTHDTTICSGNSVQLSASGSGTYSWTPSTGLSSTSISNPVASPTVTTTYVVSLTSSNGCTSQSSVIVTVNTIPTITVTGNPTISSNSTTVCKGQPVSLIAQASAQHFEWSSSTSSAIVTGAQLVAIPDTTTTYTVTASNGSCSATKTTTVNVKNLPTANFTSSFPGLTVNLTSYTASATYAWDFGDSGTSTSANPSHTYSTAGTYTGCLTVTDACGVDVKCNTIIVEPLNSSCCE